MLCLTFLLPGKLGKIIRRCLFPIVAIGILYFSIWIFILKQLKINSINQYADGKFVFVVFEVSNESFSAIELRDMNIKNFKDAYVTKKSKELPTVIPRYGRKEILVGFKIDDFKTAEVEVKALLNKYTITSSLQ